MKTTSLALLLTLGGAWIGCMQTGPVPPGQISARLGPILKIEDKVREVICYGQILDSVGGVTEASAKTLKAHFDVFYVYYLAATIHLANGNTKSHLAAIELAEQELHIVKAILKDELGEIEGSDSGQRRRLPDETCKPRVRRPNDTF
jgi:hypothetical protein